jgi:hypothetical protein
VTTSETVSLPGDDMSSMNEILPVRGCAATPGCGKVTLRPWISEGVDEKD